MLLHLVQYILYLIFVLNQDIFHLLIHKVFYWKNFYIWYNGNKERDEVLFMIIIIFIVLIFIALISALLIKFAPNILKRNSKAITKGVKEGLKEEK